MSNKLKIIAYQVAIGYSVADLVNNTNYFIKHGFSPIGSIVKLDDEYLQALAQYEESKPLPGMEFPYK